MSAPTEKHLLDATGALGFQAIPEGTAWKNAVYRVAGIIAAAEERGMKRGLERAAEIAQEPVITGNQHAIEACVDFMEAWEMGADDAIDGIVKCILLQVEIDQSPATTSPQATPAGEGVSSPSSPAPIHEATK